MRPLPLHVPCLQVYLELMNGCFEVFADPIIPCLKQVYCCPMQSHPPPPLLPCWWPGVECAEREHSVYRRARPGTTPYACGTGRGMESWE